MWLLLKPRAIMCRNSISGRHCVHMSPFVPGGVPLEQLFHTYRNNLRIQGHRITRTKAKVQVGLLLSAQNAQRPIPSKWAGKQNGPQSLAEEPTGSSAYNSEQKWGYLLMGVELVKGTGIT